MGTADDARRAAAMAARGRINDLATLFRLRGHQGLSHLLASHARRDDATAEELAALLDGMRAAFSTEAATLARVAEECSDAALDIRSLGR